ncbi:MAG: SCP2 sterol-binding domain-containing protein [Moraxella sp.]
MTQTTTFNFLTQSWFDAVARLNQEVGELNLPPNLAELTINVTVKSENPTLLHLQAGKINQHHIQNADATIYIDQDTLNQIIHDNSVDTALEAFMTGKIFIEGDMSKVMALQSARPSQEQKALYKQIKEMTNFNQNF